MVSELLALLDIADAPEKYVDYLLKHKHSTGSSGQGINTSKTPNIRALAEEIALNASTTSPRAGAQFLTAFDRLRTEQVRELEPFIQLLHKVHVEHKDGDSDRQSLDRSRMEDRDGGESSGRTMPSTLQSHTRPSRAATFSTPGTGALNSSRLQHHRSLEGLTPALGVRRGTTGVSEGIGSRLPPRSTLSKSQSLRNLQERAKLGSASRGPEDTSTIHAYSPAQSTIMDGTTLHPTPRDPSVASASSTSSGLRKGRSADPVDEKVHALGPPLQSRLTAAQSELEDDENDYEPIGTVSLTEQESWIVEDLLYILMKMWYYLHPSLDSMAAIAGLLKAIRSSQSGEREGTRGLPPRIAGHKPAQPQGGGGILLGLISQRMICLSGDQTAKQLYAHLLSSSSVPYFETLRKWIHFGEVLDPYDEFMIQERRGLSKEQLREDFNDIYWEQRYTLREDAIPTFLEPYKGKILLAGKYLNVVRECGVKVARLDERNHTNVAGGGSLPVGEVLRAIDGGRYAEDIEKAYQFANQTLLDLLFNKEKLMDRLRSLKHYFFLDQSDFLVHFFDIALEQLVRPARDVPLDHVRSLLELVLRNPASVSAMDPFKEDVVAEIGQISLVEQLLKINSVQGIDLKKHMEEIRRRESRGSLYDPESSFMEERDGVGGMAGASFGGTLTGIDAFTLGYTVRFPVSLVLNKKVLTKYQLLFRNLFHCKYVERQLSAAWKEQGKAGLYQRGGRFLRRKPSSILSARRDEQPEDSGTKEDALFVARLCALRAKMLHFVQEFMYYVCYEVLEPSWASLEKELPKVKTVDEVLQTHNDFLDTCLKECMLTNPTLIKLFSHLMTTCTKFCTFTNNYTRHKSPPTRSSTVAASLHSEYGVPIGLTHAEHPSAPPSSYPSSRLFDPSRTEKAMKGFETEFVGGMRKLIDALQYYGATETPALADLMTRMDYNLFYGRLPPDLSVVGAVPVEARAGKVMGGQGAGGGGEGRRQAWSGS
ncbi:hypothetical protein HDV00_006925 [Rhizophlyctis rosea]|nr:hypothetical protein HDV00_006925 [Rhizophlyctis rosea]